MTDEQPGPYTGSIPQAYRNAIFWRWAPEMPRGLPGAFVTLLYALGTAADAAGKLQFRDGRTIRVQDIARAVKADEKDVRRYLKAALAAGVILAEGESGRGKAPLYILVIPPRPNWDAAAGSLAASRRKRKHAPPWLKEQEDEENGGVSPELPEPENGGHTPELVPPTDEEVRGTHPPTSSGDTPPPGSGDTPPNFEPHTSFPPWGTHGGSQEIADVGDQPQDAREPPTTNQISSQEKTPFARCQCGNPLITLPGQSPRTHCRSCEQTSRTKAS